MSQATLSNTFVSLNIMRADSVSAFEPASEVLCEIDGLKSSMRVVPVSALLAKLLDISYFDFIIFLKP